MAIIGRLLEAQGFRVGIIAQPDWTSPNRSGAGPAQPVLRRHGRQHGFDGQRYTADGDCATTTPTLPTTKAANAPTGR